MWPYIDDNFFSTACNPVRKSPMRKFNFINDFLMVNKYIYNLDLHLRARKKNETGTVEQ